MYLSFYPKSFYAFYNKFCNSATVIYLLIFGLFFIFLADIPNLKEEIVYAILLGCGEHVTISVVFELPPNDYCKTLVSLLSL